MQSPYGERLLELKEVENYIKKWRQSLASWIPGHITFLPLILNLRRFFVCKSDKKKKAFNRRIECTYYQYFGPKPQELEGPFAED